MNLLMLLVGLCHFQFGHQKNKTYICDMEKVFLFDVLVSKDFSIEKIEEKNLRSISKVEKASEWVKLKSTKKNTYPNLSSSKIVGSTSNLVKVDIDEYLGCFCNGSNNVEKNEDECAILSAPYTGNIGFDITQENFWKVVSLFGARKIITDDNWITHKDEYFIPNESNKKYGQFKIDSLIVSLFDTHANSSSLRQVEYKDQLWDIKNEFFWISVDRMKTLADNMGYDELYNDARTASDRHVYKLLFGEERIYDKLSDDAKGVLDKATELVERSMELRQVMADDENHLNSWDAGYAQLKLVWKEYFQEDFTEFRRLYKVMEDRMRPFVYELGFLVK